MWYVMSSMQRQYDLSERLIRAISNWQTIAGQGDNVATLLDLGAEVNRCHGTLLPLHMACMVGDEDCLQLLIERGAELNALDGYGRAAIHYAAEKEVLCVEALLLHGAQVDIRDSNMDTALHWATFKNQPRCVRCLLENGANVNASNYNSDTPLSWACLKGSLESMKILLEYNAQVDTVNLSNQTPIMRVAIIHATGLNTDKDDACLELVLKACGQFDLRDPDGQLPKPFSEDNKLSEMLLPYCKSPRSLNELCRFSIRTSLGCAFLPDVVPKLPIPSRLQEYLLLQR